MATRLVNSAAKQISASGYAVLENAVPGEVVQVLVDEVARVVAPATDHAGHAFRNVFDHIPGCRNLIHERTVCELVNQVLGPKAFAVRALFFDKIEGGNWHVPWHQDQAIAIRRPAEAEGFGPFSVKNGTPHAKAPAWVLEEMLAIRVHLDDCGPDNGPLRVIPGSHRHGSLPPSRVEPLRAKLGEQTCTVRAGGLVAMRPLCLHASSPATQPSHRRVIHIEFAGVELPEPLEWFERHAPKP